MKKGEHPDLAKMQNGEGPRLGQNLGGDPCLAKIHTKICIQDYIYLYVLLNKYIYHFK